MYSRSDVIEISIQGMDENGNATPKRPYDPNDYIYRSPVSLRTEIHGNDKPRNSNTYSNHNDSNS